MFWPEGGDAPGYTNPRSVTVSDCLTVCLVSPPHACLHVNARTKTMRRDNETITLGYLLTSRHVVTAYGAPLVVYVYGASRVCT